MTRKFSCEQVAGPGNGTLRAARSNQVVGSELLDLIPVLIPCLLSFLLSHGCGRHCTIQINASVKAGRPAATSVLRQARSPGPLCTLGGTAPT